HDGKEAEKDGADGHNFWANALDRAFDDGGLEIVHGVHAAGSAEFVPGMVEVKEHDDAGLSVKASEGNETDPDGDAHVVAKEIEKPKGSNQGERHGKQNDSRFYSRPGVQVDQHEDYQQSNWNYDPEALFGAFEVFKLAGPLKIVSGRELHDFIDTLRGSADVT